MNAASNIQDDDTPTVSVDDFANWLSQWGGSAASSLSARANWIVDGLTKESSSISAAHDKLVQSIGESFRDLAHKADKYANEVSSLGSKSVYRTAAEYYGQEANKLLDKTISSAKRLEDFSARISQQLASPLLSDVARFAGPLVDGFSLSTSMLTNGLGSDAVAQVATGIVASEVLGTLLAFGLAATPLGASVAVVGLMLGAAVGSAYGAEIYDNIIKPVADLIPPSAWDAYFSSGEKVAEAIPSAFWEALFGGVEGIADSVNTLSLAALQWTAPRDPLVLDLTGDGLQTSGINASSPLLFDHDADGTKTATGWISAGDAMLVRDLNGNGTVDTGRELFGDETQLQNGTRAGQFARDGFEALADLDSNADGVFDARDLTYANVLLWQDHNQDGTAQGSELFTLDQRGISAILLTAKTTGTNLGGGNVLARTSSFIGTDGHTGLAGSVSLTSNPFYREDTAPALVSEDAAAGPSMRGSGAVKDLQVALSLETPRADRLRDALDAFSAGATKAVQMAALDALVQSWGATSTMHTSVRTQLSRQSAGGYTCIEEFAILQPALYAKVTALEQFNGITILEHWVRQVAVTNLGSVLGVSYSAQQQSLIEQAYSALRESVYAGLVLQTRLRPYLDAVGLVIGNGRPHLDASAAIAMAKNRATLDPYNVAQDMIDLERYAADATQAIGWDPNQTLEDVVRANPGNAQIAALLAAEQIVVLGDAQAAFTATNQQPQTVFASDKATTLLGGGGNDHLYGGNGNDVITDAGGTFNALSGGGGNDTVTFYAPASNSIDGGSGDDLIKGSSTVAANYWHAIDTIRGCTGNDTIQTGSGADTVVFERGDGRDTWSDQSCVGYSNSVRYDPGDDTLQFGAGITANDLLIKRTNNDLVVDVTDPSRIATNDRITLTNWFINDNWTIEHLTFTDGSSLGKAELTANSRIIRGTNGNDSLIGYSDDSTITGASGNDTINDAYGDDLIDGGTGDDIITDGGGSDTIDGGAGNDAINDLGDGINALRGGGGNDTISFWHVSASNTIEGGSGNDLIKVNSTASANYGKAINTIRGGTGNDTIQTGSGADTVVFERGDGRDTWSDQASIGYSNNVRYDPGDDTLQFGAGITADDLLIKRVNNDLVVDVTESGIAANDRVTLTNWFINDNWTVEHLTFADGSSLGKAELTANSRIIRGTEGNDSLIGYSDNSIITGAAGNDTIADSQGNDLIDGGTGDDLITDGGGSDTIDGGAGNDTIDDLGDGINVLRGGDGNDTVSFWHVSASNTIDGGSGNDLIKVNNAAYGNYGKAVNTIRGGTGNDTIQTGSGADTVVFERSDGQDTWSDQASIGYSNSVRYDPGDDTLQFGAGIAAADLWLSRSGSDMVIKIASSDGTLSSDQLTITGWFLNDLRTIEHVRFADGSELTKAQLALAVQTSHLISAIGALAPGSMAASSSTPTSSQAQARFDLAASLTIA
jgi:Ca2+-binding RTX toxin-like protein